MQSTIQCPKCKQAFEISEAIADQISEEEKVHREEAIKIAREEERKNVERKLREEASLKEKNYETQLKEDRERIERLMQEKRKMEQQEGENKKKMEEALEAIRKEEKEKATKKIQEELDLQLRHTKQEAEENKEKNKKLQEQLLELTRSLRTQQEKTEQLVLENEKKLFQERESLKEEITKRETERIQLILAEKDKQMSDMKKALDEARRKSEQQSQQLQGEVLELDLEARLREQFIYDDILPVPKGVDGADIFQKVKNKMGQVAGSILWETKRTKSWSNAWPAKLRDDKRRADATVAILVSDMLPEGIETFGLHENIWVVSYKYAIHLANVLRVGLFEVAIAKSATTHKDERLESLYQYLTNNAFRNRFEAQVESIIEMESDLNTEQRSTVRIWKKREMQIKKLRNNLSGMYGELQGIIGNSLPTIQNLDVVTFLDSEVQEKLLEE